MLTLNVQTIDLTDEQFYQLAQSNPEIPMERSSKGELIIMSPVGAYSGNQELEFGTDLTLWNRQTQLGEVFSSSTIFNLPNGGEPR